MSIEAAFPKTNHYEKPVEQDPKTESTRYEVHRYDLVRMNPSMDPGLIAPSILKDKGLQEVVPELAFRNIDTGIKRVVQNTDINKLEEVDEIYDIITLKSIGFAVVACDVKTDKALAKGDFELVRSVSRQINTQIKDIEDLINILTQINSGNWELAKSLLKKSIPLAERLIHYIYKSSSLKSEYSYFKKVINVISKDSPSQNADPIKSAVESIFLLQPKADPLTICPYRNTAKIMLVDECFDNAKETVLNMVAQAVSRISSSSVGIVCSYLDYFKEHRKEDPRKDTPRRLPVDQLFSPENLTLLKAGS